MGSRLLTTPISLIGARRMLGILACGHANNGGDARLAESVADRTV
jgi:hypothetical protein